MASVCFTTTCGMPHFLRFKPSLSWTHFLAKFCHKCATNLATTKTAWNTFWHKTESTTNRPSLTLEIHRLCSTQTKIGIRKMIVIYKVFTRCGSERKLITKGKETRGKEKAIQKRCVRIRQRLNQFTIFLWGFQDLPSWDRWISDFAPYVSMICGSRAHMS